MSSILKALKKLEQEKALRREGDIDLSREILHGEVRRKARFSWPWLAAITTILLLATLVALLLPGGRETTLPPPLEAAPQPAQSAASPESMPLRPALPPPEGEADLKQIPAPATRTAPARITMPLPPLQKPAAREEVTPPPPRNAAPVTLPPAKTGPPGKQAQPAEPAEPLFTVSGIAWNKDSADRLAIVNGQPLATGSAVGGAVVEEILPDRVRFSQGGRTFEVHLGKAGKTH